MATTDFANKPLVRRSSPMDRVRHIVELWECRFRLVNEIVEIDKEIEGLGYGASPAQPATAETNGQSGRANIRYETAFLSDTFAISTNWGAKLAK